MQTFFVYLLIFPNSKVYVGMSRTNRKGEFTARYFNHAREAKNGKETPLYRAWRKYGPPKLVVLSTHGSRDEAGQAEIEMIAILGSADPREGYNVMLGGQGLNAPKGSAIHRVMTEKVWQNPERNAKLSAALKGRPPSEETMRAYQEWLANGGIEIKAENTRKQMAQPGAKEAAAELTRAQMTPEAREHLSRVHSGRADPRTPEGKRIAMEGQAAFKASPEGKAAARKGYAALMTPGAKQNRAEALSVWRSSEANRENNRRRAQLSAAKNRQKVEDISTGVVYGSQREMARALGISEGAVSLRVKQGRVRRV